MVVVMTSVQLQKGHVDAVRDLFASTNPGLVAGPPEVVVHEVLFEM